MDALEYNQRLVSFESTSNLTNAPVSDYCEEVLSGLGFAIERIEYDDPHGVRKVSVLGKKGEGTGGMAYFGHTDVVPADPWHTDDFGPFEPTIVGERLYGRGSCDMKGSIACMFAAAERLADLSLKQPVYVTCTSDEEIGYGGATAVAQRSELFREMVAGGSRGIIGEPTMLEVVYAHKGTTGLVATSHGTASHSSTTAGLNANLAMIPYLAEMKAIHDETESSSEWQNDAFDPPTLSWNIGINDHTAAVNITPPKSVCTVYFRAMPGQEIDSLIERAQASAQECGIEFVVKSRAEPLYIDPDSPFVREVLDLAGRDTPTTVCYGTDGGMLTELSNMVVIGPGDIAQAHTWDEFIDLEQLELGTDLYARMIEEWCG